MNRDTSDPASESAPRPSLTERGSRVTPQWVLLGLATLTATIALADFVVSLRTGSAVRTDPGLLLGLSAAILIFPSIQKFKFGGLEFERAATERIQALENALAQESAKRITPTLANTPPVAGDSLTAERVRLEDAGLGSIDAAREEMFALVQGNVWESDPNRGRFGGSSRTSDTELFPQLDRVGQGDGPLCRLTLTVRRLRGEPPLVGAVRFFLHPSYGDAAVTDVLADGEKAVLQVYATGVYTVGVLADGGKTKLEYALSRVPNAPRAFLEN